jgi:hypothetical protein
LEWSLKNREEGENCENKILRREPIKVQREYVKRKTKAV